MRDINRPQTMVRVLAFRCSASKSQHNPTFTSVYRHWILTGNARSVRILVRVLHVLDERVGAEEQLVTDRTRCGIRAANHGGMLLQNAQMQLQFLDGMEWIEKSRLGWVVHYMKGRSINELNWIDSDMVLFSEIRELIRTSYDLYTKQ